MEKRFEKILTIIDEDVVYKKVKRFIKKHGYEKISHTQFEKMYRILRIKKESITKKRYSLWFYKKTDTGYSIVITTTFDENKDVKKSFLYFAVFAGNKLLKSKELSKDEISVEKLENLENIFVNIPNCPDCKKPMRYRNDDSYLCENFKRHTPEKCIKIGIRNLRVEYVTLSERGTLGKAFTRYYKRVSVLH